MDVFSPSMHYDPHAYLDGRFFENIRFAALDCAAREIYRNGVEGHIAECGVYRGDFASLAGVRKAVMEYCRREHIGYMRIPDEFDTAVLSKPL